VTSRIKRRSTRRRNAWMMSADTAPPLRIPFTPVENPKIASPLILRMSDPVRRTMRGHPAEEEGARHRFVVRAASSAAPSRVSTLLDVGLRSCARVEGDQRTNDASAPRSCSSRRCAARAIRATGRLDRVRRRANLPASRMQGSRLPVGPTHEEMFTLVVTTCSTPTRTAVRQCTRSRTQVPRAEPSPRGPAAAASSSCKDSYSFDNTDEAWMASYAAHRGAT